MSESEVSKPLRAWAGRAPAPYDAERVAREMEDFLAAVARIGDEKLTALAADEDVLHLLSSLFGNSPFLGRILRLHADWLPRLLDRTPDAAFDDLLARTAAAGAHESQADVMSALRLAKSEAALLIAMADISGAWPLERVTDALTSFADAAVDASIEWLLRNAAARGQILKSPTEVSAQGS